ncbi:MAG: ABC transporter ATP-binding protein [Verrucomicrobiaceae bacterium]|nr:ABC transporter ATP-binding protein [Verrucomicrobiaceae bacterium]
MPASNAAIPASPAAADRHDADTLAFLSQVLRSGHDESRIREAVSQAQREKGERLELLVNAAEIAGIKIEPFRLSLADAVWMARNHQPIILWRPDPGEWLILRRHGFFSVRACTANNPGQIFTISRSQLAQTLGLKSINETVDLGVVTPERPAEGLRGRDVEQSAALMPSFHINPADGHHEEHVTPIKRFFGLLQPEMKDVWTIFVFSIITGLLYLALPLAVNALVSNLSFGGQTAAFLQALVFIALALFAFLLLSAVIRGLQFHVAEVIQRRIFVRVAADMAYRLPRVKADSLDGIHAPEMVNRFLDVVTVQKSTSLLLLNGINIVLGAIIGLVVLGFYHPFLLAYASVLLSVLLGIVFVLGRGAVRTSIQESICKYDVVNWLEELARYPRLFKGPGGYALAAERADQLVRNYLLARTKHFRIWMRQIGGLLLLEVLASAILLIVGGWLVLNQQLTLGQLVAAELIVSAVLASVSKLGKQFEAWYDALAAVDKLGHLVDIEIESEDGDHPTSASGGAHVSASGLTFSYPNGCHVFSDVSFELAPGSSAALMGAQGSGCSTLLDVLLGLRYPTAGHVSIDGFDLRSWYLEKLRSCVMLIRSTDIVHGTILENIRLGRPDVGLEQVTHALKLAGLLEDVLAFPSGMHTPLVTGGLPLSSRQRIRLLIARALVLQPRLLLLDDIFDGMDESSMEELTRMLLLPERGWTVIIATRDPLVAAKCDKRVVLGEVSK